MFFNNTVSENQICAIDKNGSITYGELSCFCDQIADVIPKRSLVFSLCENAIGSVAGYVAFLSNGVVPLLLNADMDRELFDVLSDTYKPQYLWVREDHAKHYCGDVVCTGYGYALLKTDAVSTPLYEELGLLLTTSGSTGSPKLVRQSYHNIMSNARAIAEYLELTDTERPITTLPMNYTYGLSIINSHLLVGATLLLTDASYIQKEFWNFFKEQEATSFGGVPYTYEILKKLRFFRMELPSLRYMTQAGGKLSPELHKEFAQYAIDTGKRFYIMYGQTEATARMAYLPYEKALEKYGSMGVAIPGGRFELTDVNGKVITEADVVGELVYYGDNVTLGYAECAKDLEKGDERAGMLITGDMAKMDADGFFYIVGRKKRFLKIFGNRVNLDEVERMLSAAFSEYRFACAGVDDKLSVFVEGTMRQDVAKEIIKHLAEKTGLHPSAFRVLEIENIPMNEAGKTIYGELPI